MKTYEHFIILILEYNLFPIVVFLLTYLSEEKGKIIQISFSNSRLRGSGYELVLIQMFVTFSIFLRLISVNENDQQLAFSCDIPILIITLYLLCVFVYGWFKYTNPDSIELSSFRLTFYSTFISWWICIGVLGIYSQVFTFHPIIYVFLIAGLLISIFFFNGILKKNFITWNVLYLEFTNLLRRCEFSKAQQKGMIIVKRHINKEGMENFIPLIETITEMGYSYFVENDKTKNEAKIGINLMLQLTDHSLLKHVDSSRFYTILAGLYCNCDNKQAAIDVVNNHIPKEEIDLYMECINTNKFDQLIVLT